MMKSVCIESENAQQSNLGVRSSIVSSSISSSPLLPSLFISTASDWANRNIRKGGEEKKTVGENRSPNYLTLVEEFRARALDSTQLVQSSQSDALTEFSPLLGILNVTVCLSVCLKWISGLYWWRIAISWSCDLLLLSHWLSGLVGLFEGFEERGFWVMIWS